MISFLLLFLASGGYLSRHFYITRTTVVPEYGGTYRESSVGTLGNGINPLFCNRGNTEMDLCNLLFSGLGRYDLESARVVPDLAERWEVSPNSLNYTFFLRDDVYFHDGRKLTADDIIFTYELVQDEKYLGSLADVFRDIRIDRVSDLIVRFSLPQPNSFFLRNATLGILPKHLYEDVPVSDIFYSQKNWSPVGTGPYRALELTTNSAKLQAYPKYHGGQPYIENVVLNLYPNSSLLMADIGTARNIKDLPLNYSSQLGDSFQKQFIELLQFTALFFNNDSEWLRHAEIRKVLKLITNRQDLMTAAFPGLPEGEQAYSPVTNPVFVRSDGQWEDTDFDLAKSKLDVLGFRREGKYWERVKPGIRILRTSYSRTESQDARKVRAEEVEHLKLRIVTVNRPEFVRIAEKLVETWTEFGIETILSVKAEDEILATIESSNYDVLLYGVSMGHDLDLYSLWHSSQGRFPGLNFSRYSNFEVDNFLASLRKTFDEKDQAIILNQISRRLLEDAPALFLYTPRHLFAVESDLKNLNLENMGVLSDRFLDLPRWHLKEKRVWNIFSDSRD